MSEEISFELSDENIEEHATRVKDEATRAFRRLLMLPRRGRLLFRDNDSAINWERPVNREAIIGQTRGEVTSVTCGRCQNGLGPFSKCVVVEGFFSGSCTNCHYNSQGSRCSLRGGKFALLFLKKKKKTGLNEQQACRSFAMLTDDWT